VLLARIRRGSICLAFLFATACTPSLSNGPPREPSSPPEPAPTATISPSRSTPSTPPTSVSLRAPRHGSFLVRGSYPRVRSRCKHPEQPRLKARYPGRLSVRLSGGGTLDLTLTIPFERYLDGIAEEPPSWPMAALEAQAVAARSYALATTGWTGEQGAKLDTPICATASCQVYRGIPVPPERDIGRWYRAVRRTEGLVLLFRGHPADTVYFSTSNGHTYGNDQVFGGAPLPYLRPVAEHDDGASPLSRWRVTMSLGNIRTFLGTAGLWADGQEISSVTRHGSVIEIEGRGTKRSLGEADFRAAVNEWAPCLEPRRYPPFGRGGARLPVTVPSAWYSVAAAKGAITLTGRGWGHGVGMVQWGAHGKAQRGLSAAQILAYYYGGLRPRRFPEPGLIHVQVATGLKSVSATPSGPGAELDGRPVEKRGVRITGGDRIRVRR
jgi:SpoIID/LytB domain protein